MKKLHAIAAAVVVLFASGCGGGGASQPSATQQPVTQAPAQSARESATAVPQKQPQTTQATATPEQAQQPAAASGSDTTNVDDLSANLDKLKSYRMHYVLSFSGKDTDGKDRSGSLDMTEEYITASKNQHTKMTGTDSTITDTTNAFETFQVDGTSYMYNPQDTSDQKCVSFSSGQDITNSATSLFKPSDFLGALHNARLVKRSENVNGVDADHYQADQQNFTLTTFTNAKGDIWIASDGGYVVRYVGEATGTSGTLASGSTGTFKWEYNIEDANKIESIQLPAECAASKPAEDIPIPPNATDKGNLGTIITFKSPDDVATVTDFFKKELPANGWSAAEGSMEGILSYTKENRTLTIMVTKDDSGGSSAMITEAKK